MEQERRRVEVRGEGTRCPYCHDTCEATDENVVCRQCLARHHTTCWGEGGCCASCGAVERMVAVEAQVVDRGVRERPWLTRRRALAGLLLVVAVVAGWGAFAKPGLTWAGYQEALAVAAGCLPLIAFLAGWVARSRRGALVTPLASVLAGLTASVMFGHLVSPLGAAAFFAGGALLGAGPALLAQAASARRRARRRARGRSAAKDAR